MSTLNLYPAAPAVAYYYVSIVFYFEMSSLVSVWQEVSVGVGTKNVCGHWRLDHVGQRQFI